MLIGALLTVTQSWKKPKGLAMRYGLKNLLQYIKIKSHIATERCYVYWNSMDGSRKPYIELNNPNTKW